MAIRKRNGYIEIERDNVALRLWGSTIEMAFLIGEDSEWYPIMLTDDERRSVALTLLTGTPTIVRETKR